jgi:hypothetical protein
MMAVVEDGNEEYSSGFLSSFSHKFVFSINQTIKLDQF